MVATTLPELAKARANIRTLQEELAETSRGLLALTLELEQRVDQRTAELRQAHAELQRTSSELLQLTLDLETRVESRTEEVRRLNRDLERRVRERTAELQAKNADLRESEERYRLLFDSNPQPIWVFDLQTLAFLAVNEAAIRQYGYSREEFLAMTIKDIRPVEDIPQLLSQLSTGQHGRDDRTSWRHQTKDGSLRQVEIHSHRLALEGRDASLVVVNDVTERKRAEERFRALAETANDAIVSADSRGNITYFNPSASRTFGYLPGEAVGQPLTLLMPERYQAGHQHGLHRFLETGEAHVVGTTVELIGKRRDGSEFPLELSLACWTAGGETCFTGVMRDITGRKRAEQEIRERGVKLEAANKELEAFSYSVSHDLRAPLRAIHGYSQALLQEHSQALDDGSRGYLKRVCHAAEHMANLINDLLNLSRVTRAEMLREPVDLSALAQAIAGELKTRDPDRNVQFEIQEGLEVAGDPRMLRVALQNLLENAWKFTAGHNQAHIAVGVTEREGQPVYFVRDDGAGFNMAYVGKLFGAFQRLHSEAEFPGTGIGLATVQRIIQRHGGEIWAESKVGKGATFYFRLTARD